MVKVIFSTFLLAAFAAKMGSSWVLPEPVRNAAAAATISAALVGAPLVSNAGAGFDFTGSYSDPKHPNCKREVVVSGASAKVSGTDGNPGCPASGAGKPWSLAGEVKIDRKEKTLLVDFSPKGGPANLKGVWDESAKGIKWPDGNIWSLN
jgi:hypothetical protein